MKMDPSVECKDMMYAYSLGLVSGLSAKILAKKDFEQMANSKDLNETLYYLENTIYVGVGRTKSPAAGINAFDDSITVCFSNAYREAASTLPQKDRAMLDTLFKGLWDLENIKSAARSFWHKTGEKPVYTQFGDISPVTLEGAAKAGDMRGFASKFPNEIADVILKSSESKSKMEFEGKLEKQYLTILLSKTKGDVREYLLLLADALNIRVYLACKLAGVEDVSPHVINEGYHLKGILQALIRQDVQGFIKDLSDTPYQAAVIKACAGGDLGNIHLLDPLLNKAISEEVKIRALLKPMSINPVIHYLRQRQQEALGVRGVIYGKLYGLTPEDIVGLVT